VSRRVLIALALAVGAALLTFALVNHESTPLGGIVPPGRLTAGTPSSGGSVSETLGAPVPLAPGDTVSTASAAPTTEPPPPYGPGTDASPVDVRQDAKIARGLSRNPDGGLRVDDTPPGSLVEEMRLLPGDVITAVNGEPVTSPEDFVRIYRAQGRPTQMTVMREGRELHRH